MRKLCKRLIIVYCISLGIISTVTGATITVDRSVKEQVIDGFGFFGGKDVWWSSSNPSSFYSQAWLDSIIDDLGITIWRNEYYSELGTDASKQDATWSKQKPTVQAKMAIE